MEIVTVPIENVIPWAKNPRGIKRDEFERLKRQIEDLGIYKPLVGIRNGSKVVILGGNMRLLAMREMGFKTVDVSIVKATTDGRRLKFNISDNDRHGYYERQALAEIVQETDGEITLPDFKIDIGEPISLKDVLEDFGPSDEPGPEDGEMAKRKPVKCPECGHEFVP